MSLILCCAGLLFALCAIALCAGCCPRLAAVGLVACIVASCSAAAQGEEISVAAIARRSCASASCSTAPPVSVSSIARRQAPAVKPPVPAAAPAVTQAPVPTCVGNQCFVGQPVLQRRRGLFGFGR